MNTYIKLAWRNLWRNKKRTLIAAASVFFAVILALLMRSMQTGYYDYMIDASVRMYTGYIQIHGKDYWEKRSLDESMTIDAEHIEKLKNTAEVTLTVPRFETFSLISHGNKTKVAQITGINPQLENQLTEIKKKIIYGKFLDDSSKGIILAKGLAEILKVDTGDSVVIYGQGYHGVTAAAQIPITGIIEFTLPELNKSFTYLSLAYAQWLFSAPERLTSLSIMVDDPKELDRIKSDIKNVFDENYEVMDWKDLSPELIQSIQIDNAQGIIMLGILYVVIAFGIFGTIMMMTAERIKEFGILISVGMKKWKLALVSVYETLFISFIGVAAGAIISVPILFYFRDNPIPLTGEMADAIVAWGFEPILPFAVYPGMFFAQIWTVLAIAAVSAIYPVLFIRKLKPVEAFRG
ncbi:MAG: FtsX-like permease family protein [Ignavibacterium sp.]|jgi:ABC-type lipoprotein release transport system permease subunit|nr:FtsX-like permease family protein [Ignavibacterium sp.]